MAVESFKFINHKTQVRRTVCSTTHTSLAGPSLFPTVLLILRRPHVSRAKTHCRFLWGALGYRSFGKAFKPSVICRGKLQTDTHKSPAPHWREEDATGVLKNIVLFTS